MEYPHVIQCIIYYCLEFLNTTLSCKLEYLTCTVLAPVFAQFHSPLSVVSSVYLFPDKIQFSIVQSIHCWSDISTEKAI